MIKMNSARLFSGACSIFYSNFFSRILHVNDECLGTFYYQLEYITAEYLLSD